MDDKTGHYASEALTFEYAWEWTAFENGSRTYPPDTAQFMARASQHSITTEFLDFARRFHNGTRDRLPFGQSPQTPQAIAVCALADCDEPAAHTCHTCGAMLGVGALALEMAADGSSRLSEWYCAAHMIAGLERLKAAIWAQSDEGEA